MRKMTCSLTLLGLALAAVLAFTAETRAQSRETTASRAIDRGATDVISGKTPISVTITLALPALSDAEKLLQSVYTPGNPQFHQFLSAEQFSARFGPADADVARVVGSLAKYHLAAQRSTVTTLKVTGLPADFERAFLVNLHTFEVPAHDTIAGYTYHAPMGRATVPAEIASSVSAVVGFNNAPAVKPLYKAAVAATPARAPSAPSASTSNPFGALTVADFAQVYDVNPLYKRGLTGAGRTLGVMTFAAFTPSDVFQYWQALGLKVNPNRIKIVNVDGGPGAPSDASGSIETTLDVEQAGGVAPGANIIVYQGANFYEDLVDVFAKSIDDNKADTLAMSWGAWEWLFNLENDPVNDPFTGETVAATQAIHELLLRAALQGQTVFAASGDGGAYQANDSFDCYGPYSTTVANSCNLALSTIYPGGDSLITATGGTTLPGLQEYCLNAACTAPYYDVNIAHERVWGWDYLIGLCATLGYDPISCGIFPAGGGGGVSVAFSKPWYQAGVFGTQLSQPGQSFSLQPYGLLDKLPAFYPGRNVPDVSFNADPNTGYVVYYTSSATGFALNYGYGGTSFVDQQFSGVTALLEQDLHQRIGFLNPTLYYVLQNGRGYVGPNAPFRSIAYGDNWFYYGSQSYNPGAGVGVMDVNNFDRVLERLF